MRLFLFLILPITELYLLFALADVIGGLGTLLIVICTAAIGISLLRRQGAYTLGRVNQRLQQGELPGQEIVEGMLLTIAAVMLITPGLITDTLGFVLLTPALRRQIASKIIAKGMIGGSGFYMGGFSRSTTWGNSADGDIIDGEVVERDRPREGGQVFPRSDRDPD